MRLLNKAMWKLLLSFLILSISSILAADHSGVYKGDLDTTSGKVENVLTLLAEGEKLTGTLKNQFGELPLQGGVVEGDDFFFYVIVKEEDDDFKMTYRGHIFQDEIQFRVEAGERQLLLVVKKDS